MQLKQKTYAPRESFSSHGALGVIYFFFSLFLGMHLLGFNIRSNIFRPLTFSTQVCRPTSHPPTPTRFKYMFPLNPCLNSPISESMVLGNNIGEKKEVNIGTQKHFAQILLFVRKHNLSFREI